MSFKKNGLTIDENNILFMIHNLHGKRFHHPKECFRNETGEKLIFIKDRQGDAQFPVNLTLLAQLQHIFASQLAQNFLMPSQTSPPQLLSGCETEEIYHKFIVRQLEAPPSKHARIAS
jgi:hypothetical protein